jgi:hypothetical protein
LVIVGKRLVLALTGLRRFRLVGGADVLVWWKPELARKFHDNAVRSLTEGRAAELAARALALADAQSVEDLTAPLTSARER